MKKELGTLHCSWSPFQAALISNDIGPLGEKNDANDSCFLLGVCWFHDFSLQDTQALASLLSKIVDWLRVAKDVIVNHDMSV